MTSQCPFNNWFVKLLGYLLVISTLQHCKSKNRLVFNTPTNGMIKQASIGELKVSHEVYFAQYEGFYISTTDPFFTRIYLIINDQEVIDADIISKDKIELMANSKVKKLRMKYVLKSEQSKIEVKNHILSLFSDFQVSIIGSEVIFKNKCGDIVCTVNYYDSVLANYVLEIYPSSEKCM